MDEQLVSGKGYDSTDTPYHPDHTYETDFMETVNSYGKENKVSTEAEEAITSTQIVPSCDKCCRNWEDQCQIITYKISGTARCRTKSREIRTMLMVSYRMEE